MYSADTHIHTNKNNEQKEIFTNCEENGLRSESDFVAGRGPCFKAKQHRLLSHQAVCLAAAVSC